MKVIPEVEVVSDAPEETEAEAEEVVVVVPVVVMAVVVTVVVSPLGIYLPALPPICLICETDRGTNPP
jgi:hypothetical protein